jgi:hypothetical protein
MIIAKSSHGSIATVSRAQPASPSRSALYVGSATSTESPTHRLLRELSMSARFASDMAPACGSSITGSNVVLSQRLNANHLRHMPLRSTTMLINAFENGSRTLAIFIDHPQRNLYEVHYARECLTPVARPWLWQPYAANIVGPIASLQQITAQTGDDGRGFRLRRFDRLAVHSWRSLVAHYVQQRPCQIGFALCFFGQPTGVGRAGVGTARLLALRFLQQKVSPLGCVRALNLSAPRRAVGEHEDQLSWSLLSQSISSFAPLAFASLLALMRSSDFCVGVVPSSLPPSGLPLARSHADLPG